MSKKQKPIKIFRSLHNSDNTFTVISNKLIEDKSITPEAKGVMLYILSRPSDWEVYHNQLQEALNIGKDALKTIMNLLVNQGYASRQKRGSQGKKSAYDYCFYEEKRIELAENPPSTRAENPPSTRAENPPSTRAENPPSTRAENPPLLNTEHLPNTEATTYVVEQTQQEECLFVLSNKSEKEREKEEDGCFSDEDQEKIMLLSRYEIRSDLIPQYLSVPLKDLKKNIDAYEQYLEREEKRGNDVLNKPGALRRAIEKNWMPNQDKFDKYAYYKLKEKERIEKLNKNKQKCIIKDNLYKNVYEKSLKMEILDTHIYITFPQGSRPLGYIDDEFDKFFEIFCLACEQKLKVS